MHIAISKLERQKHDEYYNGLHQQMTVAAGKKVCSL